MHVAGYEGSIGLARRDIRHRLIRFPCHQNSILDNRLSTPERSLPPVDNPPPSPEGRPLLRSTACHLWTTVSRHRTIALRQRTAVPELRTIRPGRRAIVFHSERPSPAQGQSSPAIGQLSKCEFESFEIELRPGTIKSPGGGHGFKRPGVEFAEATIDFKEPMTGRVWRAVR